MLVPSSDASSLDALLDWWEGAEYVAEVFVILGCVGEFVADFTKVRTEEWRHQLSKVSLLVLIAALAVELGALVRTNGLSGQEIALLNGVAADARTRAADAESSAKGFDSKISEAKRGTAEAFKDAENAKERASANEKEAARLGKLAEDERLARLKLEAGIQPRTLALKQQQDMANACSPFSGHGIGVFSYSGDAESAQLAAQIMAALGKAGVRVENRVGAMVLVGGAPSAGVFISNLDPGLAGAISKSLAAAGIPSTIIPPRSDEKEMTMTVGIKPYGILK